MLRERALPLPRLFLVLERGRHIRNSLAALNPSGANRRWHSHWLPYGVRPPVPVQQVRLANDRFHQTILQVYNSSTILRASASVLDFSVVGTVEPGERETFLRLVYHQRTLVRSSPSGCGEQSWATVGVRQDHSRARGSELFESHQMPRREFSP